IGDLNGDGRNELVVTTLRGQLNVLDSHGAPFGGFPVTLGPLLCPAAALGKCAFAGALAAPVITSGPSGSRLVQADLTGRVHVMERNGTELNGSPVDLRAPIVATPAVADLNDDGWPDIIAGSTAPDGVYWISTGETSVGRNPLSQNLHADGGEGELLYRQGVVASPLLANLDRTGEREIIVRGAGGPLQVLNLRSRDSLLKFDSAQPQSIPVSAAVCDFDGTGLWQLTDLEGSNERYALGEWQAGAMLRSSQGRPSLGSVPLHGGFPVALDDGPFLSGFVVADVDGDGSPEILFGGDRPLVYAVSANGLAPSGWPKQVPCGVAGNVTVGMMNNHLVVAALSRCSELYAWSVTGVPESIQWDGFHHDPQNTGSTGTPLPPRKLKGIGIDNPPGPAKGCCTGAPGTMDVGVIALALIGIARLLRGRAPRSNR
ncbi:MAG: hypothetical protein ACJ790_06080, partial [Myxococcaceae bacterium]